VFLTARKARRIVLYPGRELVAKNSPRSHPRRPICMFGGPFMWVSRAVVWVLCLSLALPGVAVSQEQSGDPQPLPKTVAAAAFKNGLAFVVRQGTVRLQSGAGRITPIPSATLGTLWLAPGEAGTVMDEIVSYRYAALREDPNSHEKLPEVRSALRFKVKGATDKIDLTLGYLEHGIGWTPSY